MSCSKKDNVNLIPDAWVKWTGYFNSVSGYAEASRTLLKGLAETNFNIAVENKNFGFHAKLSEKTSELINNFTKIDLPDRYISLQSIPPPEFKTEDNSYLNIARFYWEYDRIPQRWVNLCNRMDVIWVASSLNSQSLIDSGVSSEKVFILPDAVDIELFNDNARPQVLKDVTNKDSFKFLSIFDWVLKKGWDVLIEAYIREFDFNEDVCLVIRTFSYLSIPIEKIKEKIFEVIIKKVKKTLEKAPRIIFVESMLSQEEIPGLYKACDCFVLPSRGEGWGRPYMEAMAMGLPVIGTGFGGNIDFMKDSNSFLLDYRIEPVSEQGLIEYPDASNTRWAEPSCEHLMYLMRFVFENQKMAKNVGAKAQEFIRDNFNTTKIAGTFIKEFKLLKDWDKKIFKIFIKDTDIKKLNNFCNTENIRNYFNKTDILKFEILSDKKSIEVDKNIFEAKFIDSVNSLKNSIDYMEKVSPGICHSIVFVDCHDLCDKDFHAEEEQLNNFNMILNNMKNWADLVIVNRYFMYEIFKKNGFSEESLVFIKDEFNSDAFLKDFKQAFLRVKRFPIKKNLNFQYYNMIRKNPLNIRDLKSRSGVVFVESDRIPDFEFTLERYIKNNLGKDDITLIICTNPGRALFILSKLSDVIAGLRYPEENIPDILILDEVLTCADTDRLMAAVDFYIPFDSSMNIQFLASAARFATRIENFKSEVLI